MSKDFTADDVRACFKFILGREPENERVLSEMLQNASDFEHLRQSFIQSQEFQSGLPSKETGVKPIDWPKINVQSVVDEAQLEQLFAHVESNWQMMGEEEPHWSVLTSDLFKQDSIGANFELFYNTSQRDRHLMEAAFARSGRDLSKVKHCFELGCGVGRMTSALADMFERVTAVDISQPHLDHAKEALSRLRKHNVHFEKLQRINQISEMDGFDLFYSIIVLQHNPPPIIRHILDIVFGKVNPGGFVYFQVPTYILNANFDAESYMKQMSSDGEMEMHPLPQHEIFDLLHKHGFVLREIREDHLTGSLHHISNTILAQKI
jgi:SAM-dependent methyltransferase